MQYSLVNLFSIKMLRINHCISRFEDAKTNATLRRADCNLFFSFFFPLIAVLVVEFFCFVLVGFFFFFFFLPHSLFWFSLHSKARFWCQWLVFLIGWTRTMSLLLRRGHKGLGTDSDPPLSILALLGPLPVAVNQGKFHPSPGWTWLEIRAATMGELGFPEVREAEHGAGRSPRTHPPWALLFAGSGGLLRCWVSSCRSAALGEMTLDFHL